MNDNVAVTARVATKDGAVIIGCDDQHQGRIRLTVVTTIFLGASDHNIFYRLDEQKQGMLYADYVDNMARNIDDKQLTGMLDDIKSASLLRIRLVTYRGDLVDLEFPTDGAAEAIGKAGTACGDKRFAASSAR